jgi:hypothetical protein
MYCTLVHILSTTKATIETSEFTHLENGRSLACANSTLGKRIARASFANSQLSALSTNSLYIATTNSIEATFQNVHTFDKDNETEEGGDP